MSATGRGAIRREADFYETPAWCVQRLIERDVLPGHFWLEPCAGEGAIIRAASALRPDVRWHAVEMREECRDALAPLKACLHIGDFLQWPRVRTFDAVVTNPPYGCALAIAEHAIKFAPVVALLCRLNWLEGGERHPFLREHMPDVHVLPNRPSFTNGGTDATAYAWMVFRGQRRHGIVDVLPLTSRSSRVRA